MGVWKVSVDECILLIEMVRANPTLYDTTSPDYRDSIMAPTAWQHIAETMGRHDMEGEDWKKKWKSMRDMYTKKRRLVSTSKNPKVVERAKKWRFQHLMNFLEGHIDDRRGTMDSDNAEFSDAEGDMDGDEDSASSEKLKMGRGKISVEETIQLIEMVGRNPSLYDTTAADLKAPRKARFNMWQNITETMGRYDMEDEDWKKKWKFLRDAYVKKRKTIRSNKNPEVVERAKHWRYFHLMKFLEGHIDDGGRDDCGPAVDSDNAELSDAERDMYGQDDSASCSEKFRMVPGKISDEDCIQLIEMVQRNPTLYDTTSPDYRDPIKALTLWQNFAETIGRHDMEDVDWKKKWRSLRNMYVRNRRLIRNAKNPKVVKKWRFLDLMNFLEGHIDDSGSTMDSDNAEFSDAEGDMDGDEDSANCSEKLKMVPCKISDEDSILLIEMVRMNPTLYDTTSPDFRDPIKAITMWQHIAETIGRRDMEDVDWKKKWKNLRDTYVRKRKAIRNKKNPDVVESAKKWRFLRLMKFLEGHIDDGSSRDDCGPAVDSDNAELSDAERDMYGQDDSASRLEKLKMVPCKISDEDCILLIEMVRANPILYDTTSPDYRDPIKALTWKNIAETLGRRDMEDWKKKWKVLRDTYVKKRRTIRNQKNPKLVESAKKWRFLRLMKFLEGHIDDGSRDDLGPAVDSDNAELSDAERDMSGEDYSASRLEKLRMIPGKISVEDCILLIELVRMNPTLYDTTSPDYRDPIKALTLWQNIAETIGRRDMEGVHWKKKWGSLQNMYVRNQRLIRTTKYPKVMERAQNWPFLYVMNFLEGHIDDSGSMDDCGPTVYSDNAELRHAEGDMYGDEDSASCSEKPILSLDMSCQPEMTTCTATPPHQRHPCLVSHLTPTGLQATPPAPSLSSSALHSNGTSRRATPSNSQGQKRTFDSGEDHETESLLTEMTNNHKKSKDDVQPHLRSAEHVFFDNCALRMANLPHETRSYLQLQISHLFFNAENPDWPPVPVISLPQHEAAQTQRTPSYVNLKTERDAY
ncbi:uncharacterized protein [Littorina saxatilis]|uniref:uncharacterized protein isoform X2 n=1 Tax=Littorina saxatilis TaxID=31220 RepID=UPI0038B6389A